jgi:hypothetical protein
MYITLKQVRLIQEPTNPDISITGICEILYLRILSMAWDTSSVRATIKGLSI